ncbi:MAG: SRPBCC domain-containing protein [Leptospiraceae bacterium]|nr:SRPBCC domain-containing protein [Leptospiraceae bacterium]
MKESAGDGTMKRDEIHYGEREMKRAEANKNTRNSTGIVPEASNRESMFKRSGLLLSSLALLFLGDCKSIHTEVEIQATPEEVWTVLKKNGAYGEWNPYHVRVEGDLIEGNTILVEVHKPNGNQIVLEPTVLVVNPNRELTWGGGIPGLFTGEHVFEIFPTDTGVLLVHREEFKGIFVPFAELDTIEEGYRKMNEALKKRVEEGR